MCHFRPQTMPIMALQFIMSGRFLLNEAIINLKYEGETIHFDTYMRQWCHSMEEIKGILEDCWVSITTWYIDSKYTVAANIKSEYHYCLIHKLPLQTPSLCRPIFKELWGEKIISNYMIQVQISFPRLFLFL